MGTGQLLCVHCKTEIDNNAEFCDFCNKQLSAEWTCPNCGTVLPAAAVECCACHYTLHPTINVYLRNDKSGFMFSCNLNDFFNKMIDLLIQTDARFAKMLTKVHLTVNGEYYILSKITSKKKDRIEAYNLLKNHMLQNGFSHEFTNLIVSTNFIIISGSN
jgi:hypothetical protein